MIIKTIKLVKLIIQLADNPINNKYFTSNEQNIISGISYRTQKCYLKSINMNFTYKRYL